MNIKEDDLITGIASWFDCYFTHGKKNVILSTSILKF